MKRIYNLISACMFVCCLMSGNVLAQRVTLDYYYNHETRKGADGRPERFHYIWNETDDAGFSKWGEIFRQQGFTLDTLDAAPTATNLQGSAVYLIADPDTRKETSTPHYIAKEDVDAITAWVKRGGILVMLANDSANVELTHFNHLADRFGMHFNDDLKNHVVDDKHFEDGAVYTKGNPVFLDAPKIFMKDVCSISTQGKTAALLKNKSGATLIAVAKFGKGTAVAVADPWLYNEYVNGRLPLDFANNRAAVDFTIWLKKQLPDKRNKPI